jgi:YVTN family beta-propeller protein
MFPPRFTRRICRCYRREVAQIIIQNPIANRLVAIVDVETNEVMPTIPVGNRAWSIALDPTGSQLYTANGASNEVSAVDAKSRKELHRIKVGGGPRGKLRSFPRSTAWAAVTP